MKTILSTQKNAAKTAAGIVKKGGVIVFPTETSYGLGCDATNKKAVAKIYALKKRPTNKPLPVIVCSVSQVQNYAVLSPVARRAVKRFMPGPLTLVVPLKQKLPVSKKTIAFRISSNSFARSLAHYANAPIVSTSANLSGEEPVFSFDEAGKMFGGKADLLVDAGNLPKCKPSTIVDLTGDEPVLVRPGKISFSKIEKVLRFSNK